MEDEIAVATGSSAMPQMKLGSWCCPLRRYDVRRWYRPNDLGNLRGRRGRRGRKQTELQAVRQDEYMQAETPVAVSAFQADVLRIPRPGERYGCA